MVEDEKWPMSPTGANVFVEVSLQPYMAYWRDNLVQIRMSYVSTHFVINVPRLSMFSWLLARLAHGCMHDTCFWRSPWLDAWLIKSSSVASSWGPRIAPWATHREPCRRPMKHIRGMVTWGISIPHTWCLLHLSMRSNDVLCDLPNPRTTSRVHLSDGSS